MEESRRERGRTVLEARDLTTRRGRRGTGFELRVPHVALRAGEVTAVLGPNGSGKTTLLRALAGLDRNASFSSVSRVRGPVVLVFQRPAAFSGSVAHNVGVSLLGQRLARGQRAARIAAALARFGIEGLASQDARTLSGGELRRLALARAFVLEPEVMLLDEPFDDLDAEGQRSLSLDLQRLVAETGMALVVVTHDLRRALLLADRIAVLMHGRLVQSGARDEVLMRPRSLEVARTVGMTNLATGRVVRRETSTSWVDVGVGRPVPTAVPLASGRTAWIGIRPEHLKIAVGEAEGESIGRARVESCVSDGLASVVTLSAQGLVLSTHLLSGRGLARRLSAGDEVELCVRPEQVHGGHLEGEPSPPASEAQSAASNS